MNFSASFSGIFVQKVRIVSPMDTVMYTMLLRFMVSLDGIRQGMLMVYFWIPQLWRYGIRMVYILESIRVSRWLCWSIPLRIPEHVRSKPNSYYESAKPKQEHIDSICNLIESIQNRIQSWLIWGLSAKCTGEYQDHEVSPLMKRGVPISAQENRRKPNPGAGFLHWRECKTYIN